jgi:hypothetical protein
MAKTLTEYLYGIMQNGSDGVGGDWSAEEAAKAIEYEAEQYLKSQRTQPAPETGEWSVVANETASDYYHLIQNNQTIGVLLVKPEIAAQIIADHTAVPRLVAALETVEAAFFADSQSGGVVEKGEFIPLDNQQHPWIPGARAWPVINQIRDALTTLRREG